jgi:hypothetical protein
MMMMDVLQVQRNICWREQVRRLLLFSLLDDRTSTTVNPYFKLLQFIFLD